MPSSVPSTAQFVVGNISGGTLAVDTAPSVSDITKNLNVGGTLAFAAADFTGAFTDPDNNALQKVMITALPQHGTLKLGGTAVVLNQEIPVASLGTLSYTPGTSYTGSDSFAWNASDGSLYAVAGATVDLTVNAVWIATGGGSFTWSNAGNWQGGVVPGAAGGAAVFGAAVGSGTATITLDTALTLGSLTFSPGAVGSYILTSSGGSSLQLANSGGSASISVASGSDAINAPIILGDSVNVSVVDGTSLKVLGPISQSGGSDGLTLSGGGSLTLSGTNSYTGGTVVSSGTLVVTSPSALSSSGQLNVGRSGVVRLLGLLVIPTGGDAAPATTTSTATLRQALRRPPRRRPRRPPRRRPRRPPRPRPIPQPLQQPLRQSP